MFEVTSCNANTGVITVEDFEFGLKYEFICPDARSSVVRDEYDLHVTRNNGTLKVIRILD